MRRYLSDSLQKFIDSGLLDYAYVESRKFPLDLSLGINPLGCSDKVKQFLKKNSQCDVTNYPEVLSDSLRGKIGKVYGISKENILIGVGVSELLHLSLLAFINQGEEVLIPEISFPAFEFVTILVRGNPRFIPFNEDFDLDYEKVQGLINEKTKVAIICNPNNPTGKKVDNDRIVSLISHNSNIIFLVDEANIDFGGKSFINFTNMYRNLLVARSFSKGFGLAGLRIGFIIGDQELISALKRRQTPFMVNIYAQKVAEVALNDMNFLTTSINYCQKEREYLEIELKNLGYQVIPSDSNYLLVDVTNRFPNSSEFVKVVNAKGINVVNGNNFRGLKEKYVRLCPRMHKVNQKFIEALKNI